MENPASPKKLEKSIFLRSFWQILRWIKKHLFFVVSAAAHINRMPIHVYFL